MVKRGPGTGLNIVSLFAGAGGLEIAACSTGRVNRVVSTDANRVFLSTTELNLPEHFPEVEHASLVVDARDLKGGDLLALMDGHVDVVMGGPPCDDFTSTGLRRGFDGIKGPLIYEFARLVSEIKPTIFLFENVPNLANQFRSDFDEFLSYFEGAGYHLRWEILSACHYGAPTIRKRIVLVGARSKKDLGTLRFPSPTHGEQSDDLSLFESDGGLKPYVQVRDVLHDLPDRSYAAEMNQEILNHTGRKHRPSTVEHMKEVPAGVEIGKSYRYRAPWFGVCRSLTAGLDASTKSYIHPVFHREMTVREYARIHCFPDTWFFSGTHHNGIKQVANSVPIPLGAGIWEEIHDFFGTAFTDELRGSNRDGLTPARLTSSGRLGDRA
jgi:DNA (cytosine-5)-methyltransferase 1